MNRSQWNEECSVTAP